MGEFHFKRDNAAAHKVEDECIALLESIGFTLLERREDFWYDAKMEKDGCVRTFEIKHDMKMEQTRNVGVEFSCNDRPSGISTTKADYYVYKLYNDFHMLAVSKLKKMIANENWHSIVPGGDGENAMMYLFTKEFYMSQCDILRSPK